MQKRDFQTAVQMGSVARVVLRPSPDGDSGWVFEAEGAEGFALVMLTKQYRVRVFRTLDAAERLARECGFTGTVAVVVGGA